MIKLGTIFGTPQGGLLIGCNVARLGVKERWGCKAQIPVPTLKHARQLIWAYKILATLFFTS